MNMRARHGGNYFITFIDDFTRFGHVYLISHKSEALDCFIRYTNLVENKLSTKIKALRTDRGREYLYEQFKKFCDEKGIARQLTIFYTPQQNSVAERRNRTLFDMVRSMMAQANLPISFWGDTLLTAAYILNCVPSKSVSSTPYELQNGVKPNLGYFHLWGCATYIYNTSHEYGKLDPRGKKCIFIRYSKHSKGFVFIGEKTDARVTEIESRDVVFLEKVFPKTGEVEKDFQLYEIENLDYGATSHSVEDLDETFNPSRNSESDILSISTLIEQDHEQSQPRRSIREPIPRRRFEIEGKTFIHKMMKNLKHSVMLYLVLKQVNGLKLWKKKWSQ